MGGCICIRTLCGCERWLVCDVARGYVCAFVMKCWLNYILWQLFLFINNCCSSKLLDVMVFGEPWGTSRQACNVVLTMHSVCINLTVTIIRLLFEHSAVCAQVD